MIQERNFLDDHNFHRGENKPLVTASTESKTEATTETVGTPFRQKLWNSWKQFPFGMKTLKRLKKISPSIDSQSLEWNPVGDVIQQPKKNIVHQHIDDGTDANPYVTFRLKIHLKEAHGLVIRDASGSSDPYVKFKYQDKTMYKSNTIYRSLNPNWDEEFAFLIDDPTYQLRLEVFDYDRFMMDDSMGNAIIELIQLKLFETHELKLMLEDENGSEEYMGYLQLSVTVTPLTETQKNEFLSKASRGVITEVAKRGNKAVSVWLSAVNIVLVEAKLNYLNFQQHPDSYVKFKLCSEKCKSKIISKSFEPKWYEQYDLHIYDENFQTLDVMVHDKSSSNAVIGKCSIDLKEFEREKTEEQWYQLEEDAGSILLLLTISGTSASANKVSDLRDFVGNRNDILEKYSLKHSLTSIKDIGHLTVKVFKAENLAAADLGGKSDPFCVLELVNARLQTHTEYKTLNPEWNKLFTFAVKDIHEALEITVFDEDPNKKVEFLGKVSIPLLKIRNCEKRRILLEMDFLWNPIKAAVRTFNPREKKFICQEPKFKPSMLMNSVNRLKSFGAYLVSCKAFIDDCLSWRSYPKSIFAFLTFVTFVYFIQIHHFPMLLLLLFVRFHIYHKVSETIEIRFRGTSLSGSSNAEEENRVSVESDDDEMINEQNEKSISFMNRFQAIQDILQMINLQLDFIASLLERFRNTFNFTIPYLSYLAIVVLCIAAIVLYLIPIRWLIMFWVPSDNELRMYREFRANCEDPSPPPPTATKNVTNESSVKGKNKKGN
uniref:C2 domain-containing protein n=1 Tax=Panagrolaimus sp. PS1159 TaxID=55785 RepID=A0AC35FVE0_9BILA